VVKVLGVDLLYMPCNSKGINHHYMVCKSRYGKKVKSLCLTKYHIMKAWWLL